MNGALRVSTVVQRVVQKGVAVQLSVMALTMLSVPERVNLNMVHID